MPFAKISFVKSNDRKGAVKEKKLNDYSVL